MAVIDRYLLKLFIKVFAVCFVSLAGLYIVVHLFTNLDDFLSLVEKSGGAPNLFAQFYGPRILDLFDRTVGILILIAAVAALAWMQRRRELTAIEAAGIPKSRLVKTIVVGSTILIVIAIVNREWWIPWHRHALVSTLQNWSGAARTMPNFQKDHLTGLRISGEELHYAEAKIQNPVIQLPLQYSGDIPRIVAKSAWLVAGNEDHPAGLLLENIVEPKPLAQMNAEISGVDRWLFTPNDNPWLSSDQIFIACTLTLDELAFGPQLFEYSSTSEMIQVIRRPTQWYSHGNRIALHARLVRPLLDITLLLVTLPIALLYTERNLFFAAMACVAIVLAMQLAIMASFSLGSVSIIKSSALAAWIPVIIFSPLTVFSVRILKR